MLKPKSNRDLETVAKRYAVKVTPHVMRSIQNHPDSDPIAKQYLPQADELKTLPEENADPIGDDVHMPVKGIVHRYTDRVLYKIASVCAVYCRYCFRREKIGPESEDILKEQDHETALNYIRNHPEIWEVILTGGDPLILSPARLRKTLDALENIDHVKVIRIHTRIPVADPDRVTDDLCDILRRDKPIYIAVHINHANEMTTEVKNALRMLHEAGCVLLSQSVLLKGINDNAETLEKLFRTLAENRVKPYYLHHPDLAPGTSHFRLPIQTGQKIMRQLLGRLSGICQPHYMLDIPGGYGKVPIGPTYIECLDNSTYHVKDPKGKKHTYPPKVKP